MLLKALFLAVLIYFALKTAGNMYRAIQEGGQRVPPPRRPRRPGGSSAGARRAPQERATRDRRREDVEDATWEDIE